MELLFTLFFYLFLVFSSILIVYYLFVFRKFAFAKTENKNINTVPVSVIICAKNEYDNLEKNLPLFINQEYPNFELVLIDDASSDETLELLEAYEKQYAFIKLVKVENNEAFWGNKKYALTLGIKASKHEYLLFTDADCKPNSTTWLKEMSSQFTNQKTIVLGYGGYEKIKNSFLNQLIRYETVLTALQYFSWAKSGKAYMGVGRNLAYKKSEFYKTNGFINHMKLRSGDDDLFVNEATTSQNTSTQFSANSFTYSKPKTSYREWFKQKRRHIATSKYYKSFDKIQLALFYLSTVLFLLSFTLLMLFLHNWIIVVSVFCFIFILKWIIYGMSAKKLNEKDTIWLYPIYEISLLFVQFYLFILNLFSKPVHWK
jgi:glycosyltransferase involved in cell wall biosynthesis